MTSIGLDLLYTVTVGDNLGRITSTLAAALSRSDVVITTGGLGPTVDDVTREGVAAATERALVMDQGLVEEITAYFGKRGFSMTENNMRQARLPEGASIIHNPVGTAPCFAVDHRGSVIISLPGVPHEMRHLMNTEVIPMLRDRFGLTGLIMSRVLRTCGIGESTADSHIGDLMVNANPTVGTRAHPGQTDIVITAKAQTEEDALALIAPVEAQVRSRIGDYVFGVEGDTIGGVVAGLLKERGACIAVVETLTLGDVARRIADANGGDAFAGGTVVTDKESLRALGIDDELDMMSYPSQGAADAAARAVRKVNGAKLGLAIIGPQNPSAEMQSLSFSHWPQMRG